MKKFLPHTCKRKKKDQLYKSQSKSKSVRPNPIRPEAYYEKSEISKIGCTIWAAYLKLVGFVPWLVVLLVTSGIDIRTVSARAGHSDVRTTLNIYTHAMKAQAKLQPAKSTSYLVRKIAIQILMKALGNPRAFVIT